MDLYSGETKYIEYKKEYTKSILKTISAMANYHDGCIVLGIDDNSKIVGLEDVKEIKMVIENSINDNIIPRPYYELEDIIREGKSLILLKVYMGENTPYLYNEKAYKRMDTSTVSANKFEYENL